MEEVKCERGMPDDSVVSEEVLTEARSTCGGLLFVANWVNAAYSVDVSELCGHFLHFTHAHVRRLNKLVRYAHRLAGEPLVLHPLGGEVEVIVYGDAAFQNMNKSRSQGGAVAMLRDQETGTVAMISHYSRRVKRVARSTFAAELLNQATSYDLGVFVRRLMEWMWGGASPHAFMRARTVIPCVSMCTRCGHIQEKKH